MHVVIAQPATRRMVVPRYTDEPIEPRTRTIRQPIAADPRLLFATAAIALGLAAVTASFVPLTSEMGNPGSSRPHIESGIALTTAAPLRADRHALAMPFSLARAPGPLALSATGPWQSPLYPQNGVTLWDRIRVSSNRDRGAFLLGIAIQIHAPQTAATPGPRSELPSNSSHLETTTSTLSCGELMVSPSLAMAACAAPATGERSPAPDLFRP